MRKKKNTTISPTAAFQNIRNDYNAARSSQFRRRRPGIPISGAGADYHYRSDADLLRMTEQARDMIRNDAIAGVVVDRAVDSTIQGGMGLDPDTGDESLDALLSKLWTDWSTDKEQCDIAGELTFPEMEGLCLAAVFVDGDIVALGIEDGSLELVESHRLRTPNRTPKNVVHGILLDKNRKRLEYWLTKDDIDPFKTNVLVGDVRRIPTRDDDGNRQVFHIQMPKRVSQTRGVTAFAPIFDSLSQFEDIQFATLVKQQAAACFAFIRQKDFDPVGDPAQHGARENKTLSDGTTQTIEGISPGMEIVAAPGETITGFSPNVPSPEYFPHAKMTLQIIAVNLGVPLVSLLLDGSETNFSGMRGANNLSRIGFRRNQDALISRFHRPVYEWKVRQWLTENPKLARMASRKKINILKHRWERPGWPYMEPVKALIVHADFIGREAEISARWPKRRWKTTGMQSRSPRTRRMRLTKSSQTWVLRGAKS
jgi:lambda family phage portal protein